MFSTPLRHAKADLGSRASRSFARHHVSHMKPKVTTKISMVVRKTYVQDRRSRRVASWASWRWSSRTIFAPTLSLRTDKIGRAKHRPGSGDQPTKLVAVSTIPLNSAPTQESRRSSSSDVSVASTVSVVRTPAMPGSSRTPVSTATRLPSQRNRASRVGSIASTGGLLGREARG
jgi:hypothetical protein